MINFGNINATSTASEADEYVGYITDKKTTDCLKVVNTGTIDRYSVLWGAGQLTHARKRFLTPYLPLNKANVSNRRREMYSAPKIIFAKMAKTCEAFLDVEGEYASINTKVEAMTIKEHDRVVLKTSKPAEGLETGDVGTVAHVYQDGHAYEVEFVMLDGQTAAVIMLEASQVRPVTSRDITHTREFSAA